MYTTSSYLWLWLCELQKMDASSVLRNVSFYYYFWWLFHISCYNFYLLMLWFFFLLVRHCVLFDACIVIVVICSLNILMIIKWRVRKIPSNIVLLVVTACLWLAGPVVMDIAGYTERGFKRKLAVQALFGKVFYLSEVSDQTVKIVTLTNCLYGSVLFLYFIFFFFFLLQTTLILIIRRYDASFVYISKLLFTSCQQFFLASKVKCV